MIVQTAADGLIFTFKGPMSPKNFIFFAATPCRSNTQLRLTDQRKAK
jgi:hypothetical protein